MVECSTKEWEVLYPPCSVLEQDTLSTPTKLVTEYSKHDGKLLIWTISHGIPNNYDATKLLTAKIDATSHKMTHQENMLCNVYPLKPLFYIVKLGFMGVYLFYLFLIQNKKKNSFEIFNFYSRKNYL